MKPTQRERLRQLFLSRPNQDISLREILDMRIGQYNSRILDLRRGKNKIKSMNIVNTAKLVEGQTHSCYKYIPEVPREEQKEMFLTKSQC